MEVKSNNNVTRRLCELLNRIFRSIKLRVHFEGAKRKTHLVFEAFSEHRELPHANLSVHDVVRDEGRSRLTQGRLDSGLEENGKKPNGNQETLTLMLI